MSSFTSKLAAAVLKPKLMVLKDKMDYSEYGGAALFGLKAPVIKASTVLPMTNRYLVRFVKREKW
ncbi:hypothetical protein ACT7DH_28525 [Bacillus pacificus]